MCQIIEAISEKIMMPKEFKISQALQKRETIVDQCIKKKKKIKMPMRPNMFNSLARP